MERRIANTSREAYQYLIANNLIGDKQARVLKIFVDSPRPLTGAEVSEIYKSQYPSAKHSETVRNRITELVDMELLDLVGTTICRTTKRKVGVFQANRNTNPNKEKKPSFQEKKEKIMDLMKALGLSLPLGKQRDELREIYHLIEKL